MKKAAQINKEAGRLKAKIDQMELIHKGLSGNFPSIVANHRESIDRLRIQLSVLQWVMSND